MFEEAKKKLYDSDFRAKLIGNPSVYAKEIGYNLENVEYKVVINQKHALHLVINETQELFSDLQQVQAAGAGSASTVSTLATVGCACSTASSATTTGSAGTVT